MEKSYKYPISGAKRHHLWTPHFHTYRIIAGNAYEAHLCLDSGIPELLKSPLTDFMMKLAIFALALIGAASAIPLPLEDDYDYVDYVDTPAEMRSLRECKSAKRGCFCRHKERYFKLQFFL